MKVNKEEMLFELQCLKDGIQSGRKDFTIPLWFAEYLVHELCNPKWVLSNANLDLMALDKSVGRIIKSTPLTDVV